MTNKEYKTIYTFTNYLLYLKKEDKMSFSYEDIMEIKEIYEKMHTLNLIAIMKNSSDREIIMDICEKLRELLQILDNEYYKEG